MARGARRSLALAAAVLAMGSLSSAAAQPIVLESYTGPRPEDAPRLLGPLHDELAARGYISGDSLGRLYEARISRPASTADGLAPDFELAVERGHKAWVTGNFDDAISVLVPIIAGARANALAVAHNQAVRQALLKAQIAHALSQQRKGDLAAAREAMQELLRDFPDAQISRAVYGPDAHALFDAVRREQGRGGRGELMIQVPNASSVVFVNERFEAVGATRKPDLVPGTYRVFAQTAKKPTRVYSVVVKADASVSLVIDPIFDTTVRTGGGATGFVFSDDKTRSQHEARFAARFANQLGASAVAVVGIDASRGRPSIVGSVVDLRSGREIRRASIALEPTPTVERIRSLGSFLAGDAAGDGLMVELGQESSASEQDDTPVASRPNGAGWLFWTGLGAAVVGTTVGGALAFKFGFDAQDASDELARVCAVMCTSEQALSLEQERERARRDALIGGIAGGAVAVTGITFMVVAKLRDRDSNPVAVVPTTGGVYATYAFSF